MNAILKEVASKTILTIKELSKQYILSSSLFSSTNSVVHALRNISLEIQEQDFFVIVGESGCGKSTLAKIISSLEKPSSGSIQFKNTPLEHDKKSLKIWRKDIQMIFQNPFASLDPRFKIKDTLLEAIKLKKVFKEQIHEELINLLNLVELDTNILDKYPSECSGGQNQRVCIARCLALKPKLLIADEAISALDVSTQGKILKLLNKLRIEQGLSIVLITHDLAISKQVATRAGIMYLGELVEYGEARNIFSNPHHPYTKALLASAPISHPNQRIKRIGHSLQGELPKASQIPSGCSLHPRCQKATNICSKQTTKLTYIPSNIEHYSSCYIDSN